MGVKRHFPRTLVALAAALLFVPAGGALASQAYQEQVGDAPGGAPDMSAISVAHKVAGETSFQVTFANRTQLAGEDMLAIAIDSDQNPATGMEGVGADYLITVDGKIPEFALIGAYNSKFSWMVPTTWANGAVTIVADRAQIGDPTKGFNFVLLSHTGGEMTTANTEIAPHSGMWTYSLVTEVAAIQLPKVVSTVKAGSVFSVKGTTVKLSTDEVFSPDSLTAKATVGGKALKPLAGGLSWKVPKTAKGKKLVVTVTAAYKGLAKVQSFTMKVVK